MNQHGGQDKIGQDQIKMMMLNAQRMIEERKKSLSAVASAALSKANPSAAAPHPPPPSAVPRIPAQSPFANKKQKIADLQAEIAAKLSSLPARTTPTDKPQPLILDAEGRMVDESGNQVLMTSHMPTLKANIRAKRRAEFSQQLQERPSDAESAAEQRFFDPRVASRPSGRGRRSAFNFHEPGKFQQMAARMRAKSQLERLQSEISSIARRTGISSAMRLAMVAPRGGELTKQGDSDAVPDMEWWDRVILNVHSYDEHNTDGDAEQRYQGITNLVEHPAQLSAPLRKEEKFLPLLLTKKERKKMRRTNRREAWKDAQEKIRLGLEPAPEPKVRMSNLMRVLGNEAIQDPTKVEAHVRAQMAKRQKLHQDANAARKLTDDQRKAKRVAKVKEDTSDEVHVAIYRLKDLSNPAKKFKVETNARQLYMTGTVVLFKDFNVVVVEGGPKQQKKYKKLMMSRIKWDEDNAKTSKDGAQVDNKCTLVWEGTTKQRNFGELRFKLCPNESFAREHFRKQNVEHYWDLAYSSAVIEQEAV